MINLILLFICNLLARNMLKRAWRPGEPDGSEQYALPCWQEATERADLLTAPKTVRPFRPRYARPNKPCSAVIVHKKVKERNAVCS